VNQPRVLTCSETLQFGEDFNAEHVCVKKFAKNFQSEKSQISEHVSDGDGSPYRLSSGLISRT